MATLEMEYQAMMYLSNANYKEHNYRTACSQLEAVVLQRKTMLRFKSSYLTAIESSYPQFQEAELRYKIAVCYREMGEYNMAINTLQAVKARTPRLNMLLARLLHHHGRGVGKKEKALAYKDVLRECPMSLTSIEALLELGVEGTEVHSMVVNGAYFRRFNLIRISFFFFCSSEMILIHLRPDYIHMYIYTYKRCSCTFGSVQG